MTYTTQQLQAMPDREVNRNLHNKLFMSGVKVPALPSDYCNNPNDIMPLAFEHKITLISLDDGYMASGNKTIYMEQAYRNVKLCDPGDNEFADYNPLRAIACLLLMMED